MAWAAVPAFLRTRFNANEILVSLMLTYVAQLLVNYLVFGPWRDPQGFNTPQSPLFADAALFPILIENTRLNASVLLTLVAVAVGWVFLNKSFLGYKTRVVGLSSAAARYAGFSEKRTVWIGMLTTWMRTKYPNVVYAGLAASAVFGFAGIVRCVALHRSL